MNIYCIKYYGFIHFFWVLSDIVPEVDFFQNKEEAKREMRKFRRPYLFSCELLKEYKNKKNVLRIKEGWFKTRHVALGNQFFELKKGRWIENDENIVAKIFFRNFGWKIKHDSEHYLEEKFA